MSGELEPRRSVRATKGQHKALDQLDKPIEPPKRRGKKGKKAATAEPEEEIIRCVCGATEQDEDQGEPWIACDQCGVWQHNICMGMSQYKEDLPNAYFCELCRPQNHKELLEAVKKGEKLWEARRQAYEEEKTKKKETGKGKRGPKKGKGKRSSEPRAPSKSSPAPEPKTETKAAGSKRKARDESQDKEATPSQKLRKVSETHSIPVPAYDPPADLPAKLTELPGPRQGTAKLLLKSLTHSIGAAEKKGTFTPTDGVSIAARAERFAIEIERAVNDSHPNMSAYSSQARTLGFNLKSNPELVTQLLSRTLTPPMLASMTTEELASKELQRETAEMKARAEKQAIKITEDGPRVRRTHKGEEVVGGDDFAMPSDETPGPSVGRRSNKREPQSGPAPPAPAPAQHGEKEQAEQSAQPDHPPPSPAAPRDGLHVDTKQSPRTDFDINKVFSSVKSPTAGHNRHPSNQAGPAGGPGIDPEVDRMLQDDGNESPPYSPTEETDPDVVWRGEFVMNTVANFQATAKHIGGVKLVDSIGLPWSSLIPRRLQVAGRIDEKQAIEYLCGLRYSLPTDLVVVSLQPAAEASRPDFQRLIDYFVSKKRYGVVGDKAAANVRDTYLVPVLPGGESDQPEFMLNLSDNYIPHNRTEPMLLVVFVYRNDPETVSRIHGVNAADPATASQSPTIGTGTPTPAPLGHPQRHPSISGPAFSPASPQGAFPNFPNSRQSHTPIQPPHVPHSKPYAPYQQQQQQQGPGGRPANQDMAAAQQHGEQVAREILGPYITSPTVSFLMPQAAIMSRSEWHLIRRIYERDQRSREDLGYLNSVLEREPVDQNNKAAAAPATPAATGTAAGPRTGAGAGWSSGGAPPQMNTTPTPAPAATPTPAPAPPYVPVQTPIPPPTVPPQRNTPIPPPPIPPGAVGANSGSSAGATPGAGAGSGGGAPGSGGPPRQTPIPPPPIPPHAAAAAPPA